MVFRPNIDSQTCFVLMPFSDLHNDYFKAILAETFYCSNPDGTFVDRDGFLAQTVRTITITELRAHDVLIRLVGEIAIIHARTSYLLPDCRQGNGRYTDVWARIDGKWKALSAHVTRC